MRPKALGAAFATRALADFSTQLWAEKEHSCACQGNLVCHASSVIRKTAYFNRVSSGL